MRRAMLVCLLLLASGCLQRGDKGPDYEGIDAAVELAAADLLVQDHGVEDGHRRANQHAGAYNVALVGYSNGIDRSGDPDKIPAMGTYNELAVMDDYAYQSRASSDGTFGGFVIYDIRDPTDPFPVGSFDAQGGADIEVNADQTLVFLSTQRNTHDQMLGAVQGTQDPAAGLPRGIYVVDVSTKTNPNLDTFIPLPVNGPHTITYHQHEGDGNEYLIACTYDLVTDPATGALVGVVPVTQRIIVYLIERNPLPVAVGPKAVLTPVSEFQITESAPEGQMFFPHDTRVETRNGETLLYVAYWDMGVRILNFSTPTMSPALSEVGGHTEFSPSAMNQIHLAQPFADPIDGRHITVAEPELPAASGETGQITFLDTTSLQDIETVGHWTLPAGSQGQLSVTAFDFSPHNFDLWDGKVALAHNHAGLWIIDVSDGDNLASPKSVGWYMPSTPRTDSPTSQPNVWGVFESGGYLYASDGATGLYVLEYTGP